VAPAESPIVTLPLGSEKLLLLLSRDLFNSGVKVGNVAYPAVPRGEAILRLTVNARHTAEDLDRTVEILRQLAQRYGIVGRKLGDIRALGDSLSLDRAPWIVPRRAA